MAKPIQGPLWAAFEAAAATGGQLCLARGGQPVFGEARAESWVGSGLSLDTRTLAPGDIFIALKDARDGHDFLAQAQAAGAAAALVSTVPKDVPDEFPLLVVADVLQGLEDLAIAARDRNFGRRIGVTGSAGKTSTKEMLRAALSQGAMVHAAEKSFNNHLGVPLTLAALPRRADFGAFEMGMNHAGEITPLTGMVRPHIAIITTVAEAHLEFLGSLQNIAKAKAEILSGVVSGGAAILPADNPFYGFLAEAAQAEGLDRIIPFGMSEAATTGVRATAYRPSPGGGGRIEGTAFGTPFDLTLSISGVHQASNALSVIAAGLCAGASLPTLISGLEAFRAGDGRGATHVISIAGKRVKVLDESYNANPASMAAALKVLAADQPTGRGRRIAVLGEMKELGPDARALHAKLATPVEEADVAQVFTAGEDMLALAEALPNGRHAHHAETAIDLLEPLTAQLEDGDIVMFKGSNASKVGALLEGFLSKADQDG